METPLPSSKTESDKLTSTILLHHEVKFSFERQNQLKGTELDTHGMQMHSVSTTSGLITGMPSHFLLIITGFVVLALAALHKLQALQRHW